MLEIRPSDSGGLTLVRWAAGAHGGRSLVLLDARATSASRSEGMKLRTLVGSGDRIALVTAPIAVAGVSLNLADPDSFRVGGPPAWLGVLSAVLLVAGLAIWVWSVALILINVPSGRLITGGPYAWVRHPIYTAVALLVLPWVGFLLDSWIGAAIGVVLYLASRFFSPAEEAALARTFGERWLDYSRHVKLGWL